jgi:5S rRNA maturation endonuclease (ribonuclease M5)
MSFSSEIDFASLCEDVALAVWGKPSSEASKELRWGTHGSRSLDRQNGVWFDHEKGEGGGTLDLVPGNDKAAKLQWLRQHGLIPASKGNGSAGKWTLVREHVYHAADGTPHIRKRKMLGGAGKRQFPQEHWDSHQWVNGIPKGWPRQLYRLPDLIKSPATSIVYVTEGEGDADSLAALGFTATTAGGVSSKWTAELVEHLRDRRVVIFVDADQAGRDYGQKVAKALFSAAKSVRIVDLFPDRDDGADVTDWLKTDAAGVKLMGLVRGAADYVPGEEPEADTSTDDKKLIAELAGLDPLAYAQRKKGAAKRLKIGVAELDKLVAAERGDKEPELLFDYWTVEPSAEAVVVAELLEELTQQIHRHVVLTKDQAVAIALWILLSWVHEAAAVHSPILLVTSAQPDSGKSTLLGIVGYLARRALLSVSISGPALFRSIEKWQPTFVIDEADTVFTNNEDLREVFNSGWTRGQSVIRCDPNTQEPRAYSTFAPKALGMKGKKVPDTTMSRAIVIELKRKRLKEEVRDFDHIDNAELGRLRRRLARWANDNAIQLSKAKPEVPAGFHNRVRANWKLLLAIAEAAGPEWAATARTAAEKLAGAMNAASIGIELLTDIRNMFVEKNVDRLASTVIADTLAGIEGRKWAEWGRNGKPITTNGVARILAQFRTNDDFPITPSSIRVGDCTPKGYLLSQFSDAFDRYLPPHPHFPTATPRQTNNDGHFSHFQTATPEIDVAVVKSQKPNNDGHCRGVADGKGGSGQKRDSDAKNPRWDDPASPSDPQAGFPDFPDFLRREPPPPPDLCSHCGLPCTPANPLTTYDDPETGRPVKLHARCEGPYLGRDS